MGNWLDEAVPFVEGNEDVPSMPIPIPLVKETLGR